MSAAKEANKSVYVAVRAWCRQNLLSMDTATALVTAFHALHLYSLAGEHFGFGDPGAAVHTVLCCTDVAAAAKSSRSSSKPQEVKKAKAESKGDQKGDSKAEDVDNLALVTKV